MGAYRSLLALLLVSQLWVLCWGQQYNWINIGFQNGLYSDPNQWSPTGVPTSGSIIVVSSGSNVTVDIAATVDTLNIGGTSATTFAEVSFENFLSVQGSYLQPTGQRFLVLRTTAGKQGGLQLLLHCNPACTNSLLGSFCLNIVGNVSADPLSELSFLTEASTDSTTRKSIFVNGPVNTNSGTVFFEPTNNYILFAGPITTQGSNSALVTQFTFFADAPVPGGGRVVFNNSINILGSTMFFVNCTIDSTLAYAIQSSLTVASPVGSISTFEGANSLTNTGSMQIQSGILEIATPTFSSTLPISVQSQGNLSLVGTSATEPDNIRLPLLSGGGTVSAWNYATFTGATGITFITQSPNATFIGNYSSSTFYVQSGEMTMKGSSGGSTFYVSGTASIAAATTHSNGNFYVQGGGSLSVLSTVQNSNFMVESGSLTFSSTCTNCNFYSADELIFKGTISTGTFNITGGVATITPTSSSSVSSVDISGGGPHTITGQFGAASFVVEGNSPIVVFSGSYGGNIQVKSGNATFSAATLTSSTFTTTGGSVSFNGGSITGGSYSGMGGSSKFYNNVQISGVQGTFSGGSATFDSVTPSSSVWQFTGTEVSAHSSTFSNSPVNFTSGSLAVTTATFTNVPLGLSSVPSANLSAVSFNGGSITLQSTTASFGSATLPVPLWSSDSSVTLSNPTLSSASSLVFSGGDLHISSGSISSSTISLDGTTCQFDGVTTSLLSLTVTGASAQVSSTSTTTAVDLATLTWNGGNLQLTAQVHSATFSPVSGSSISGSLTVVGAVSWTSGDVAIASGGVLTFTSAGSLVSSSTGSITGAGTLTTSGSISSAAIDIQTANVLGGTVDLLDNGDFTIAGQLEFDAGTIQNANINPHLISFATTATKTLVNSVLKNSNNFTFGVGSLVLSSSTLANLAGGSMYLEGTEISGLGESSISNSGSLYKTSDIITALDIVLTNAGGFYVLGGTAVVNESFSCSGGNVQVAADANLVFSVPVTLPASCAFSGSGSLSFQNEASVATSLSSFSQVVVSSAVTFTQTQTLLQVQFKSGAISGAAGTTLTITDLAWTAGLLSVPTTLQGTLSVNGNIEIAADLTTGLHSTWSSGDIKVSNGATVTLQSSFIVTTTAAQQIYSTSTGTIVNQATLDISTNGQPLTLNDVAFASTQDVILRSSSNLVAKSSFSCASPGSIQIASGAALTLSTPSPASLGCTVQGAGTVAVVNSSLTVPSTNFLISYLNLTTATVQFNQAAQMAVLSLASSTLLGSDVLTINTSLVVDGASTISAEGGSSLTVLLSSASNSRFSSNLVVSPSVELSVDGALSVSAALTVQGTLAQKGVFSLISPGTVQIAAGAQWVTSGQCNVNGGVEVDGTWECASGGSLSVGSGGVITVASRATWESDDLCTVSGTGELDVQGSFDTASDSFTIGTLVLSSDATIESPITVNSLTLSANLEGPGQIFPQNSFSWTGGSLTNVDIRTLSTTQTTISGDATMTSASLEAGTIVWNSGDITLNQGSSIVATGLIVNAAAGTIISPSATQGSLTILAGGSLEVSAAASLEVVTTNFSFSGTAELQGSLTLTNVPLTSVGSFVVDSGAVLSLVGSYTLASDFHISGSGTLVSDGDLTVASVLSISGFTANGGQVTLSDGGNIVASNFLINSTSLIGTTSGLTISNNAVFVNAVVNVPIILLNSSTTTVKSSTSFTAPVSAGGTVFWESGSLTNVVWNNTGNFITNSSTTMFSSSNSQFFNYKKAVLAPATAFDYVFNDGVLEVQAGSSVLQIVNEGQIAITGFSAVVTFTKIANYGNLTVTSSQYIFAELDLYGGFVNGSGSFSVDTLIWTDGVLSVQGNIIVQQNCTVTGTDKTLATTSLQLHGISQWSPSSVTLSGTTNVINEASGTMQFKSSSVSISGGSFTNAGTIPIAAGATVIVNDVFVNHGEISVPSGAQLQLSGSANTFTESSNLHGGGTLVLTSTASFTSNASTQITDVEFNIFGAQVNFYGSSLLGNIWLSSGSINALDLTASSLYWISGTLTGSPGQFYITHLESQSSKRSTLASSLTVSGSSLFVTSSAVLSSGSLSLQNSELVNLENATFSVQGSASVNGASTYFYNNGSLITSSSFSMGGLIFYNYGSTEVQAGMLSFDNMAIFSGSVLIDSSGTMNLNSGQYSVVGLIDGKGTLASSADDVTLQGEVIVDNLVVNDGNIDFTYNNYTGNLLWNGGNITLPILDASGSFVISDSRTPRTLMLSITNYGFMNISGSFSFFTLQNVGNLVISGSSSIGSLTADNQIYNMGNITIPSTAKNPAIKAYFFNFASVTIASDIGIGYFLQMGENASTTLIGQPSINCINFIVDQDSLLSGSGNFGGVLTNNAQIVVGDLLNPNSTGTLTLFEYDQSVNGSLYMDVIDNVDFDQLIVNGNMSLAGLLVVDSRIAALPNSGPKLLTYVTKPETDFDELNTTAAPGKLVYFDTYATFISLDGDGIGEVVRNKGLSGGAIAGIVIGVIVAIIIVGLIIFFLTTRKMEKDVAIAMEAIAPAAPPSEQDAVRYAYEFYPLEVRKDDRIRELYQLHELLLEEDMLLVDIICDITNENRDLDTLNHISAALTYLLEQKRVYLRWYERIIKSTVDACIRKETLFRENNMFTKSMTSYAIMVGTGYLHTTLWDPMQKLSVIADIQSPDFDPENEQNDVALSKDVLQLMSRLIFNALTKSIPSVPTQLHIVCNHIKAAVTQKFPDALYIALGGFFFLRFLGPVIVSPDAYGIFKEMPDPHVRKAEVMVSKVMMAIVNGVLFGEKEKHMAILNDFIESQRKSLYKLLDDLAAFDAKLSVPDPIDVPQNVTQVSLVYVYNQIINNMGKIKERLKFAPEVPPPQYQCPPDLVSFLHAHHPPPPDPSEQKQTSDPTHLLSSEELNADQLTPPTSAHHEKLVFSADSAASSSAPAAGSTPQERERYTEALRELYEMDPEERNSRKRVYEDLVAIINRCGTEPFIIEERKKEKEKEKSR